MSSILSSQGVVLATAMAAVSGTIILLAFRLQKSHLPPNLNFSSVNVVDAISPHLPRSCISSDDKLKDKKRKKKKVHFAEDVVDPTGNSEEYRRKLRIQQQQFNISINSDKNDTDSSSNNRGRRGEGMPQNRAALYNGILRDRVVHRVAYSC